MTILFLYLLLIVIPVGCQLRYGKALLGAGSGKAFLILCCATVPAQVILTFMIVYLSGFSTYELLNGIADEGPHYVTAPVLFSGLGIFLMAVLIATIAIQYGIRQRRNRSQRSR